MSDLRRLFALAGIPARRMALAVLLAALTICFGVGLLTASGYLISRAAEQPPILTLTVSIVAVRFFGLGRPLLRYLDRLVSHDLALNSLGRVRSRFFARIEPLAPAGLAGFRRGDLISRMVGDVDALQGLYLRGIGPPLAALVAGTACVVFTAIVLPLAGLALAVGLVLAGVGVPLLSSALAREAGARQAAERGALTADLVELLRAAPELVVYGREDERLAAVRKADRQLARLARRDAFVAGVGDGLSALVAWLTVVAVLAIAVSSSASSSLDRVLIATLALLALAAFEGVAALPAAAQGLSATLAAGRRVLEITDRAPSVRDPESPAPAPGSTRVVLEGVAVRYGVAGAQVLTDASLHLEEGARIALVGSSGSGKTTIVNLLLRFIDPDGGRVTIGGSDIRDLRQMDVRRTFAVAGQESHVFNSSVRENLRLAKQSATDEELKEILRRVRLDEWLAAQPGGLDALVGEDGARLSGGQRQRLVIARALLSDAPVLVLDEPTAHLDAATAKALVEDLLSETIGRSVLLITHRPEGLDLVDDVLVLHEGVLRRADSSTGILPRFPDWD